MTTVSIEHNLADFELETTLEKALRSVRLGIQRPDRKFRNPAMEQIAKDATQVLSKQMDAMIADMERIIWYKKGLAHWRLNADSE